MTVQEATVESEFGPLRLGLRAYKWRYGSYQYEQSVLLSFDEEKDLRRSKPVLEESRQMAFHVWTQNRLEGRLYAYLGRLYDEWDDDLAIELHFQGKNERGEYQWWAEGGNKETKEDKDVGRIRKNYWCAAEARVSLYLEDDDGLHPICDNNGDVLSTRVKLGYNDEYESLYDSILNDFSKPNLRGNLASRFEQFAEFQNARQRAERSMALELYKRLRDILPRYRKVLQQILLHPSVRLAPETASYDLSAPDADRYLSRQRSSSKLKRIRQTEQVGGSQLPVRFTSKEVRRTPNTAANRYVAASIRRVHRLIKRVRRHLEREQEMAGLALKRHKEAFKRLGTEVHRFARYRHRLPVSARIHGLDISSAHTAEFSYDRRYVRLRQLTERLDHLLRYVDASDLPFEVEAFNVLYERWCFVRVVKALREIGFQFVGNEERRTTVFYQNPIPNEVNCRMIHASCPDKVLEVWYDRKYPVLKNNTDYYDEDRPYGLERRGLHRSRYRGWKNRPDIALEFHDCRDDGTIIRGRAPLVVTLDPTLSSPEKREDKYEYKDGIRSFKTQDEDGQSRRIVGAAWGIWPGRPKEDKWVTLPGPSGHEDHGFIHLRPDDKSIEALPHTLKRILNAAGAFSNE